MFSAADVFRRACVWAQISPGVSGGRKYSRAMLWCALTVLRNAALDAALLLTSIRSPASSGVVVLDFFILALVILGGPTLGDLCLISFCLICLELLRAGKDFEVDGESIMVVRVSEDLLEGADDVISVSNAVVLEVLLRFKTLF